MHDLREQSEQPGYVAAQADRDLRNRLYEVLGHLPHQHIAPTIAALLGPDSPLITPAAHTAALRREIEWQDRIQDRLTAAKLQVHRLTEALDRTQLDRIGRVMALCRDAEWGRYGKHDDGCHARHARCLADRILAALADSLEVRGV